MTPYLLMAASALILAIGGTPMARRLALRLGILDQPAARKIHANPVPLMGGVAIYGAFILALIFFGDRRYINEVVGIFVGASLVSLMGIIDDRRGLGSYVKLAGQVVAASILIYSGVQVRLFNNWMDIGLTMLWVVGITNAFNFLDNMDALSSGIAAIASLMLAIVMLTGTGEPRWFVAGFLLVLVGSLGGFLVHNWPPAKIFMGDAGSCFVGFIIATQTIQGTFYEYERNNPHVLLAPLCILAVPLYDFCSVILIRLRRGLSPFHADKNHFSHRLVELGLNKKYAVLTIHLVTLTTGLGGLLLYQVDGWAGAGLIVAMEICLLLIIAVLETAARRALRRRERELLEAETPSAP